MRLEGAKCPSVEWSKSADTHHMHLCILQWLAFGTYVQAEGSSVV